MTPRAGHIVTVADFTEQIFALKTADESISSSTTLQNDDELRVAVVAGAKYTMEAFLIYTGAADPAGGLKLGWTGPSGATMKWANFGVTQNVSPTLVNYNVVVESIGGGRGVGTNGAAEMSSRPCGQLTVSSTAGNLQLQWAQGTSNATATVVKAGSWIKIVRIA